MKQCGNCKYVISDVESVSARFDYDCPSCKKVKFSAFSMVTEEKCCWSCGEKSPSSSFIDNDGDCPSCGAENCDDEE